MRRSPRTIPLLAVPLLAGAALLAVPTAAAAHDSLADAAPAAGETLTAQPGSVLLAFSGTLLDVSGTGESFALRVVGPDGAYYERGCPVLVDRTSEAAVELGEAGEYTVQWQVVSSDGHPVSDEYVFDYAPEGGQPVVAGAADPFPCGLASTDAAAGGATDEDGARAAQDDGAGVAVGIAVGVAAVSLVAVVAIVLLGRRRRPGADG